MTYGYSSGRSGGARLRASASRYLASTASGALIATLSKPFGAGTTYATVGAVPGQLALTAGTIVAGATAAVVDGVYSIKVRATSADGTREAAETLRFTATAPVVLPQLGPTVAAFSESAVAGSDIVAITGVPSGATPVFTPNDGRVLIGGNAGAGWKLVVGLSASTPGTINGTISAPGATSANIAISVTSATALITNRFGMGFNIGTNANAALLFNNIARQGRWTLGTNTTPIFKPENLDALGNIILMPPEAVEMLIPRPGPLATYRLLVEWDGPGVLAMAQGSAGNIVSQTAGRAVVNTTWSATPEIGSIVGLKWAYTAAANPIMNLRVRAVDGSDNPINTGTFDPQYLAGVSRAGVVRLLYAMSAPGLGCINWTGPLEYADMTSPNIRAYPSGTYSQASMTYGAGTSQLLFSAMRGTGTGSSLYYSSAVFNDARDTAKSLAEIGMRNGCGLGGNNVSLTINAASGAGSITRTLVGDLVDFVVTPPAGCMTAAGLANYINRDYRTKSLFYTQASGAATSNPKDSTTYWLDKVRLTFSAQPAASSTITVAGTTFTFVASGATGAQVNIGASITATTTNLKAAIEAVGAAYGEVLLNASNIGDKIDLFIIVGDPTAVTLGGTTNAVRGALPTGTGAFAPLAKTYLSGGTNPVNRGGMPLVDHIALCNAGNAAPWFIFNSNMTPDCVLQIATYIRDNLAANQRPIFALDNEVWNTRFEFYETAALYAALGIINNGADPNSGDLVGNAIRGYTWKFRQVMDIVKTVFAATPDRPIRMAEGIAVGQVSAATNLLRRPADGGSAAVCIADHCDHLADAPYYGSFGASSNRNQYAAGVSYLAGNYLYNKTPGLGAVGAYYVPAPFTSTDLTSDIAASRLLPFTPTAAFPQMLRQVFSNVWNAKQTADYVQAQVNDRGVPIKKSNYECGQSSSIGSDDPTFFSPYVQNYYRDPGFLRLESIYLHALQGDTGYAQQKGISVDFNWPHLSPNGSQWNALSDCWGAQETPHSSAANSPRAEALFAARQGRFAAYWPPVSFPDPTNSLNPPITLTGVLPTITGAFEVNQSITLNLPAAGFYLTQSAQRLHDGVPVGAPVDVTGATSLIYNQVSGDLGKVINWTVTRTPSAGMGPDATYTTTNLAQTTAAVVFETETTALLARMTVPPVYSNQVALNTAIKALKNAVLDSPTSQSIWTRAGDIRMFWSHDRQAALLNWKGNTVPITDNGLPFTPFDGFVTAGNTAQNLTFPVGFSATPNYTSNDGTFLAFLMVPNAVGSLRGYGWTGGGGTDRALAQVLNNVQLSTNSASPSGGSAQDVTAAGAWVGGVRLGATSMRFFKNGTMYTTGAQASFGAVSTNAMSIFANMTQSGAKAGGHFVGASITDAQVAEFVSIMTTFKANYLP